MNHRDFEQFYRKNIDRIYRYVFFRVGQNHSVSEDLVSEIFEKALKNFDSYDSKVSKSAWIYTIAHNHLVNHYRDTKVETRLEDVMFTLIGEYGNTSFEQAGDLLRLKTALDQLSPDDRQYVTLRYLQGYTYTEISDIVNKKPGAIRMATSRAVKKLKEMLN